MQRGILTGFRVHGRWLGRALAALLVLPLLLGTLPQPALSAAAALERDFMSAVCGRVAPPPAEHGGSPLQGQHEHEHCILCATGCAAGSPGLGAAAPAFAPAPRSSAGHFPLVLRSGPPPSPVLRAGSPPRGPPSLS